MDFDFSVLVVSNNDTIYRPPNVIDGIDYLNKLRYNYSKTLPTHNSYEDIYIKNDLVIDLKSGKSKIQNNEYLRSWSKLTTAQKCKIINTFIEDLLENEEDKDKLRRDLRFLLFNGLYEQTITKNIDVEYDQNIGKLIKIFKLTRNESGYHLLE